MARESFEADRLSVSRVRTASKCMAAYEKRYVARNDEDETIEERRGAARLGTSVHDALELLFAWVDEEEYEGAFPLRRALKMFSERFSALGMSDEREFYEGRDMIRSAAQITGDVSWRKVIGIEVQFKIDVRGIKFGGYMDRVDMSLPDGTFDPGSVTVIDYKSNRSMYSDVDAEHDLQASMYMIAARQLWPGKDVYFAFDMLRHGERSIVSRTDDDLEAALDYVEMMKGRMDSGPYEATVNPLCPWCDFADQCRPYAKALKTSPHRFAPLNERDIGSLIIERKRASALSSIARQRVQRADSLLKKAMKANGAALRAAGQVVRVSKVKQPARARYKLDHVVSLLVERGVADEETARRRCSGVDPSRVSRLITERTKGWRRADREALRLELQSMAIMPHTTRVDIHEDRNR